MTSLRTSSWALIVLLCLYCGLAGASLGKMIPLIGDIIAAMHASPVQVSLLLSVVAAVAAVLAPAAGWFGDRFGDRRLLLCGILVLAAGSALGALASAYGLLLIGRVLEGAGYIAVLSGVAALMMRTMEGPRQAAGMALFSASIPAGIGVGEGLAGIAAGGDWRSAFWGHCIVAIVGALAVGLVPAWRKSEAHAHDRIDPLAIYRQPNPVRLGACLCVLTLAQFGITTLLPTYLHVAFHMPLGQAAIFGAAGLLASIVGSLAAVAILASGISVRTLAFGSFGLLGVAGATVFAAPAGVALCIAAIVFFFLAGGFANGLILAVLPRVLPDPAMRSRAGSLVNQCSNVGILLAPPLFFALFAAKGDAGMAVLVLAAALIPLFVMPFAAAGRAKPAPVLAAQGV